jgi:hypothetical protein
LRYSWLLTIFLLAVIVASLLAKTHLQPLGFNRGI